jgi:GNAT superfamily N-acetyltransferase
VLFLIDSNVAIKSDPLSRDVEEDYDLALRFQQVAGLGHHRLLVHPSSNLDIARDPDPQRRDLRRRSLARYAVLEAPPARSPELVALLGTPEEGSNDAVDQDLLAAVLGDAVAFLVTQDTGIHQKARRLGIDERVMRLPDAIEFIESLFVRLPQPPPAVERRKAHELDLTDPIWESLRSDYPGFDGWLATARREQRDALVVGPDPARRAAVCLLKNEPGGEYGIPGPLLKISTFKVSPDHSGNKYGELLLKAIFDQCASEAHAGIYVTVFEHHEELLSVLGDFGFETRTERSSLGELVLHKRLTWTSEEEADRAALDFHVSFGPPALKVTGTRPHLVPIEPRWHRLLFPDAEPAHLDDETLFPATVAVETHPFGNALRKAYLCHAASRRLMPGDPLLFYRSRDEKAVFVIGVCESVTASNSADEIAALVGRRTVYTYAEIQAQVRHGEVLVVLFRQAKVLRADPITLDDLQACGAARSWPQTIQRMRQEGLEWLRQRLAA